MRKIAFTLILCCLILSGYSFNITLAAQDQDEETSTVTLVILPSCRLTIKDQAVSETLVKDSTAESAFETGYVEFTPDKPTLTVSSNKQWKLTASSSGFTGPYNKKTGDLQLKDSAGENVKMSSYTSLSSQDQEVASHSEGASNEEHPCQYRILLNWEKDVPGTYETTVTYTLSTTGA